MRVKRESDYYLTENKMTMSKHYSLLISFFFLITSIFLSVACGPKLEKSIEETHPDGSPKLVLYYKVVEGFKEKARVEAFYEDGSQRYEGSFAGDKRDGYWIYWYANGNKWSEGYFKNDLRDGFGTTWHENGQKHFEGSYKEGVRIGTWKFWDDTGKAVKEVNYDE